MTKKKESINNEEVIELGEKEKLTEILSECYEVAEVECKKENIDDLIVDIGEEDSKVIIELANTNVLRILCELYPDIMIMLMKEGIDN